MPDTQTVETEKQVSLSKFSYDELRKKIGNSVVDDSGVVGKLIDINVCISETRVLIDCCSNSPYWMRAKHVKFTN